MPELVLYAIGKKGTASVAVTGFVCSKAAPQFGEGTPFALSQLPSSHISQETVQIVAKYVKVQVAVPSSACIDGLKYAVAYGVETFEKASVHLQVTYICMIFPYVRTRKSP